MKADVVRVEEAIVIEKPRRNDKRATLMITGRDVDRQELSIEFDAEQNRWIFLDSFVIEDRNKEEYDNNPTVKTIQFSMLMDGIWKGTSSDLAAEVKRHTGYTFSPQEIGVQIPKLVPSLWEYDTISYSSTDPGNRKNHRFEQSMY